MGLCPARADESPRRGFDAHPGSPENSGSLLLGTAGADSYTGAAIPSEDCCMNFLITDAAGFIGYHGCQALPDQDTWVVGLDNLNDYYDPTLKRARSAS